MPRYLLVLIALLAASTQASAEVAPGKAAIASAHPLATAAGFETLTTGGNAFDAAVAVSAALAVVEPSGSGLGGGGFWLLHRASDARQVMIDGREKAPLAAHRDLYLDASGQVIPGASIEGALAAGIPGEPAALAHLAERYGRLPLARSLAPAIRLARDGFVVDDEYRKWAGFRLQAMATSPTVARQFLLGGKLPPLGHVIRQPELARTLRQIARHGAPGFYQGEVAQRLVDGVRSAGGIWSLQDLADYRVVERQPIVGEYRGWRIVSAAPPSSGGIALLQMLNMLALLPEVDAGRDDHQALRLHNLIEVMRRAYRDRARYLGDSDFVAVPLARLLSGEHAQRLVASIEPGRATPSKSLPVVAVADGESGIADPYGIDAPVARRSGQGRREGMNTTHFSVIDREGNRVAATLSVNYPFGALYVPPGTGVLLNDEMDDFSAKPGVPNAYGLVGAQANAIAPGKRPLSSMSPTFVEGPDGVAILGTPGGSRIITMVLQAMLQLFEGETDPSVWVGRPRLHHQYLPDVVQYESGAIAPLDELFLLDMGYELVELEGRFGNLQAIYWNKKTGVVSAASDPRGSGLAEVR